MKAISITIGVFLLLFIVLLDYVSRHELSYGIGSVFRKMIKPELYDDTYSKYALWPLEGGQPYKARATFEYKGESYSFERTVRCYQDRNFSAFSGLEFLWYSHLRIMPVPLADGGLFHSGIPALCDRSKGIADSKVINDHFFPFRYLDNMKNPTYMEEFDSHERNLRNIAIGRQYLTIDPRTVVLSAFSVDEQDIIYSSNSGEERYNGLFGDRVSIYEKEQPKHEVSFSSMRGKLFFESQWRKNSDLVDFLKDVTVPSVVPKELVRGLPNKPGVSPAAKQQVSGFYASHDLMLLNVAHSREFLMWLRLMGRHEWRLDFSSVGVKRSFRRGCDDHLKNCQMGPVGQKFEDADKIRVGELLIDAASQPAIYFPDDKIIIWVSRPYTFSTYLM